MARRRKPKPTGDSVTDFLNSRGRVEALPQIRDYGAWQADRARRSNPAYSNSYGGGAAGAVPPTVQFNPETRKVEPTGGLPTVGPPPLPSTRGAGTVQAAESVASKAASTRSSNNPLDYGITPETGRQMLREGGEWLRGFTGADTPRVPGFFEEAFKDKGAGKVVDSVVAEGAYRLSSLMDYQDEKDLHVFGLNVSTAETIWDGVINSLVNLHDTTMWGMSGAYLAANPKYWDNRGELGNLWQDATRISPGRAATALESALGGTPLSPLSVVDSRLNPNYEDRIYGPNDDFNIADPQQEKAVFEQEGMALRTGLLDAAIGTIMDPTVFLGKGAQLARLRFGDKVIKSSKDVTAATARMDESHVVLDNIRNTIDEAGAATSRHIEDLSPEEIARTSGIDEYSRVAYLATARRETADSAALRAEINAVEDADVRAARQAEFTPEYEKRFDEGVLWNHHLLDDMTNKDVMAQALHRAQTFEQAQLLIRHGLGDPGASKALDSLAPELYMHVVNGERALVQKMIRSDPTLVADEVKKWEQRADMVEKRIDELVALQADDALIGKYRSMLSEIDDNIDYAANAAKSPVGAGPKPTAAELDLARRAIDNQLKNNLMFERALRDAEGGDHLRGAFSSRTKGVASFSTGLAPDSAMGQVGGALDRIIANSRQARAIRRSEVQEAGSLWGAGKTGWSREFYGVDPKNPIARIIAVPTRIAGVLEAGARYGWVEKPSGLIHTAGITAQESSREIRAVVRSTKMFHTEARQGRDGTGALLYRDSRGGVTTNATGPKGVIHEPLMVGGKEHADRIVQGYLDAMVLGSREAQQDASVFIDKFETDMVDAVAYYYGIDVKKLTDAHYKVNERLMDIQKKIKEQRYWTDRDTPTRNYAPWLETHLQNSRFMKNWREIDKAARRLDLSNKASAEGATLGAKARWRSTSTKDFTLNILDTTDGAIQSVWRPMVLARGGYTIRNTAEGLFRSSAYLFSAAPIFRAAEQMGLSATNVTARAVGVVRRADRQVAKAKAGAGFEDLSPGFQRWRNREVNTATTEMETTRSIVGEQRVALAEGNAAYRQARMQTLDLEQGRLGAQSARMREVIDEVNAEPFPTPAQEAARLRAQTQLDLNDARVVALQDEWGDLSVMTGGSLSLSPAEREMMDSLDYLDNVDIPYRESQLIALSDPTLAAMAHKNQTMAKRRVYGRSPRHITDTDTMASIMRDRALANPFNPDDPYTSIALQNLSADGTVRQTAAMRMKAVTGGMAAYETRYYVDVRPGEGGYFDGVATAANQIMNSDIGQIIIQGRAGDRFDDDIAADIVRFLYSDEGASTAAFLNSANDGLFAADGAFEGLSAQARKVMVQRSKENAPLYKALDDAQVEYRTASSIAGDARWQMPRARFEGDTPLIPVRKWNTQAGPTRADGTTTEVQAFGGYTVGSEGRGRWSVTAPDGTVESFTRKSEARTRARALQTADDDLTRAHWASKPVTIGDQTFTSPADVDAFLAAAKAKRDDARTAVEKADGKPLEIKGTGSREHVGQVLTAESIRKRLDESDTDMTDAIEYATEVIRRYDVVTGGSRDLQRYLASIEQLPIGAGHKATDAGDVMRRFLTDADGKPLPHLEPIVGNAAQWVGVNSLQAWSQGKTQALFRLIGTIPEDLLVRGPFYGKVFTDEANRMYGILAGQKGADMVSLRDVNIIREMAHRRALKDTKQWLYTIDRRTTFADAAERVLPFASAMQNGVTTVGRLMWHDPTVPALMAKFWQAPDNAGWTDTEDNVHVPIGWAPQRIRDAFGLEDEFVFNKKSADLITQGVLEPGAPPLIAMPASELMKNQFFGTGLVTPDTPPWLTPFGETGDSIWEGMKNYAFGEGFGASQEFASWDKLTAPWLSRLVKGLVQGVASSAAYGNTFSVLRMTDAVKVFTGEKETEASYDEIAGMTQAVTIARSLAQLLFLPVAPKYPASGGDLKMTEDMRAAAESAGLGDLITVGEAIRANDDIYYADQARIANLEARQRMGEMISPDEMLPQVVPSEELFGEAVWRAYKTRSRDNVAGLPSTQRAAKFVRENETMLFDISGNLEKHDMLDTIGMFALNPNEIYKEEPYDANAQSFFTANRLPGTNENFREVEDPVRFEQEATISAGWKVYVKAIDALELDAMRNGVAPPFSASSGKEAQYYDQKAAIESYVDSEYPGWLSSKRMRDSRADVTAETIVTALQNEQFQKSMAAHPIWRKGGYADIYVTERNLYRQNMDAVKADMRAQGIYSPLDGRAQPWVDMQKDLEARWAATQAGLRRASPSWQAIQDRYIGDDTDPAKMSASLFDDQTEEAS